jgi:hypothetical protein
MLPYLCEPRPWIKQIITIAHNSKDFVLHSISNKAIFLKWGLELVMNGQNFMSMTFEHINFTDSVTFLLVPLRKLAGAFGLSASISCYPNHFNAEETLNYVGPIPDVSYYGVNEMNDAERTEFFEWCEDYNAEVFDYRRVLKSYWQYDANA